MIGIIVLIIGIALLLQAMGIFTGSIWSFFWALLIICVGLRMIAGKNRHHCPCCGFLGHKEKDGDECCGHEHDGKKE